MNSDLIPFQFSGRTVGILIIDGEAWFVASDIARELGYAVAKDLTRTLDDDEKGRHTVPTLGGYQSKVVAGLLEHKVTTITRGDGSEKITEQVRITPKGLAALAKLLPPTAQAA